MGKQRKKREMPKSVTMPHEKRLISMVLGFRQPITEADKELARQIQEIKDKGYIVEIPNEIL